MRDVDEKTTTQSHTPTATASRIPKSIQALGQRVWIPAWAPRVGGIVIALVLVAGFARVLADVPHSPQVISAPKTSAATPATPAATATPSPLPVVTRVSGLLTWQSVASLPGVARFDYQSDGLAVAPTDGNTAYAYTCAMPQRSGSSTPHLWVTHDRSATWQDVTSRLPMQLIGPCSVQVDQVDPSVAMFSVQCLCQRQTYTSFITMDGGQTWRTIGSSLGDTAIPYWLSTGAGTTYFTQTTNDPNTGQVTTLALSTDGLQTFHTIVGPRSATILHFYAQPATGALLVDYSTGDIGHELWSSTDARAHWRKLPIPADNNYAVQLPAAPPWHICGFSYTPGAKPTSAIACSLDGGYTWSARAAMPAQLKYPDIIGIAPDGAILAAGTTDPSQPVDHLLYRLAAHASVWQFLSTVSPIAVSFFASPSPGLFWLYPAVQDLGDYPDASDGRVYVASYPG